MLCRVSNSSGLLIGWIDTHGTSGDSLFLGLVLWLVVGNLSCPDEGVVDRVEFLELVVITTGQNLVTIVDK